MDAYLELRQDLLVREHQVDGQAVFLMKDPVSNKFFRFVAFQYFVATLLDGQTSLEAVRKRVSDRMGRAVTPGSITAFVARLDGFGLLETSSAQEQTRSQSLLYYRRRLLNPQVPIDWLYKRLSWCFSRSFVVLSAFWILLALWALLTDWDGYAAEAGALVPLDLSSLWALIFLNCLVLTVHEFAHGLACRHFGGVVQDMGFLLIYFQPAFYANVSDSYLFERKRDRMIVMLAGMYSGVLIGAAAAIVWRVADPSSWLHEWSFLLIVASCWGLLFNFNPLIKLDGYFMLSDGLDIPNLRRRALAYVRQGLRAITGFPEATVRRLKRRERRIYLTYGALASVYALALIGLFAVFVGEMALTYLPEFTLIGLVTGFAATLQRAPSGIDQDARTDETLPASTRMPRLPWRTLVWIGLLISAVLILIFVKIDLRIAAPFRLRPVEQAVVRAEVAGQVETVFVDEGDTVRTGAVLVQLSTRELAAQLYEVQAQVGRAQAELRLMQHGARPEEIELAAAAVKEAYTNLEAARAHHERSAKLAEQQLIAEQELEVARTDLNVKQAAAEQTESRLKLLRTGARPEEIDARQARIAELEATYAHIEEQMRRCRITSPIDGVVITPFLREHRGKFIPQGEPVCELVDNRTLLVDMSVPEREMEDVKIALPVLFKLQGFPSSEFSGQITAIAPVAGVEEGKSIVHVRSVMANDGGLLKAGMTGLAWVNCGGRPIGAIMLRRFIRYIRTEFWW